MQAAEKSYLADGTLRKGTCNLIVIIQNHPLIAGLMQKNIGFCLNIFLHPLMDIQMIWRQIGDNRDFRAFLHSQQLERGQFQDGIILFLHLSGFGQQRMADIAAQIDGFAGRFQKFRNNGCGCGLSV